MVLKLLLNTNRKNRSANICTVLGKSPVEFRLLKSTFGLAKHKWTFLLVYHPASRLKVDAFIR